MLVGLVRSTAVLYDLLSAWSNAIRDKEFLVEMRLRNHEPEKAGVKEHLEGIRQSLEQVRELYGEALENN